MRSEGLYKLKKSSDAIGNRNRDRSACSAMSQPTARPHVLCAVLVPFAKQLQKSVGKAVRVVMPEQISVHLCETDKRTWRIFVKFQTWDFYKNCPSHSDLIKTGQKTTNTKDLGLRTFVISRND
jgi:hypothetical protein